MSISRRDFLKVAGVAAGCALAFPQAAEAGAGHRDGRVEPVEVALEPSTREPEPEPGVPVGVERADDGRRRVVDREERQHRRERRVDVDHVEAAAVEHVRERVGDARPAGDAPDAAVVVDGDAAPDADPRSSRTPARCSPTRRR